MCRQLGTSFCSVLCHKNGLCYVLRNPHMGPHVCVTRLGSSVEVIQLKLCISAFMLYMYVGSIFNGDLHIMNINPGSPCEM